MRILGRILVLVGFVASSQIAYADDPKFTYAKPEDEKPEDKPVRWKANAQAGLLMLRGNTESFGVSGLGFAAVRFYKNQLSLLVQGAYGLAGHSEYKGGPITHDDEVANNWLARLRYDRFLTKHNSIFASFTASGDKFAGYDYRLEPMAGYSRIFFDSNKQLFSGDIGYAYTYEHYLPLSMPIDADFHNARLFLYYENKVTPYATVSEAVEFLWALNQIERLRINSLTSFSSTVSSRVSLKINLTLKANLDPPARPLDPMNPTAPQGTYEKLDTVLEAVLAVTFL